MFVSQVKVCAIVIRLSSLYNINSIYFIYVDVMDKEELKAVCLSMVLAAEDILFDSDSDNSEADTQCSVSSLKGFAEKVVPLMSDEEFKQHFRLSRSTFENFLVALENKVSSEFSGNVGRHTVCADKQILITLWMLATPDSYR